MKVGRKPMTNEKRREQFARLPRNDRGCWVWTGGVCKDGYPHIRHQRRDVRGNRLSFEIYNGPVPDHLMVLHSCDNPRCVNPDHLSLGDDRQNKDEMVSRNRHAQGVRNGRAVLSPVQVDSVRASIKSSAQLSRELGVAETTIRKIRNGETWKNVEVQGS